MSEFSRLIDNSKQALSAVKSGTYAGAIETAINVSAQAKMLAPVDYAELEGSIMWKTGNMSGGFGDAPKQGKNGGRQSSGRQLTTVAKTNEAIVGTATEYAVYQEFGTRNQPAQPYLRPAVDIVVNKSGFVDAVAKAMENSVKVLPK